jgi:flagellar biosynthetic protein FlhB
MAEESDLERTEPASSRRLEQAREEGNVPHSRELAAFMVLAASAVAFWTLGHWMSAGIADVLRNGLHFPREAVFDVGLMRARTGDLAIAALIVVAPVFLAILAAVAATPFLMGGWVFSTKAMQPDFTRIDPRKGLSRMFSWQSLAELFKAILKALLIALVLYLIVWQGQDRLFALMSEPLEAGLTAFTRLLLLSFSALVGGLAIIAAIDVPFQLWQYHDRLKMTRDELRREAKESEGDPQLKARIRSQQREMARRRMMSEVPKADVVVTNPTHFAVALKYDSAAMGAPVVVAKGMNLIAQRIRELAEEHHLPVLEAPPLARALHRHAEVGEQIPATLYTAVAEVMAWVYQLNAFAQQSSGMPFPVTPTHIAVPDGLDPGAVA